MHPALQLEELLRKIARNLEASDKYHFREMVYTDLLSMVSTCTHFYRPAMERVWHTLRSFAPILHCLPSDALSKSNTGFEGPRRPLAPDDWNRVLAMSGFVKDIRILTISKPLEILCLKVISTHLNLPMTTPLFPNLQHIFWNGPLQNISAYCLNTFIGSDLGEAYIIAMNDFEMTFFIQILSQNALSLKSCSFTLRGTTSNPLTNATLEKSGPALRSLISLEFINIVLSRVAFLTLAKLPSLTRLTCFVEPIEDTLNLPCENINDLFPSLTTLDIRLTHPSRWVIAFLHTCRIPELRTITVRYAGYPWSSDMLSTAKALSSYNSLQEISLDGSYYPRPAVPSQLLASETIKPLLRCSSLRILRIETEQSYGLDDTVLEDIGRALPHLTHLSLSIANNLGNVTFKGLHALATQCPQLTEVTVPFKFTTLDDNDLQPPKRLTPCLSLKKITLSLHAHDCGLPNDLILVALVIFTTFPKAELEEFVPELWKPTKLTELKRMLRLFRLAPLQVS